MTKCEEFGAYFLVDSTQDVYVRLPEKDQQAHAHDMCGKLVKAMYVRHTRCHIALATQARTDCSEVGRTSPWR